MTETRLRDGAVKGDALGGGGTHITRKGTNKMAAYATAVQWIADNDDSDLGDPADGTLLVTIALVADLFHKDQYDVYAEVQRRRRKAHEQKP